MYMYYVCIFFSQNKKKHAIVETVTCDMTLEYMNIPILYASFSQYVRVSLYIYIYIPK